MEIALPFLGIGLLAFIVYANGWNARRRASMTAEEHERDDEEDRREANIW